VRPVRVVEGTAVPLYRADVDTDQIMPKQHLKRIERTGYGELLFGGWRAEGGFVLDEPARAGAAVLLAGPNFGSGSSREHAVWGLAQWGFGAVVAPSFADIFRSNCAKVGLLTVELGADVCQRMAAASLVDPSWRCRIDLEAQTVTFVLDGRRHTEAFAVSEHVRRCLLEGLDDIDLTLRSTPALDAYEQARPRFLPTTVSG
jgi:3-isopropylmalate/(R)-2-methylmalate dehydratase small subunit